MNLSWNNKQHLNAAVSPWLIILHSLPPHPSYIFMVSLGNSLWMCAVLVCLLVCTQTHTHAISVCWVGECVHVCVRRGVVRQLTSCANDHLTAESHNVLQRHRALYCLCCHGDIVFSTIKCWYWLIVLASSGLFFYVHTYTQTHTPPKSILFYAHTHTHYHSFIACVFFMASVYWSALGPIWSRRSPLS